MKKAFTGVTIEISAREIEIMAQLSWEFREMISSEMEQYKKLVEKHGEAQACCKMPKGYRYMQYMSILKQFENLHDFGDTELPF